MSWRNWYAQVRWTLGREWFGVWEVRNYYARLEERARIGAQITFGYFLLVLAAATIATGGLLINSPAVIIGSMCVAPFLGPSRAVCIGALFRDRRIFLGGLFKQLIGLLLVGSTCAYLITIILAAQGFDLPITAEIAARSMPTTRDVVLSVLIATASGVAASLALVADPHIVEKYDLKKIRIGDVIAIRDHYDYYGRGRYEGAVTIGVVIHGWSDYSGHGPGSTRS